MAASSVNVETSASTIISRPLPRHMKDTWSYVVTNPFKPEFTIVIFIHYKPRIAVAILDL